MLNFSHITRSIKKVVKLTNDPTLNSRAVDFPKGLHINFLRRRLPDLMNDMEGLIDEKILRKSYV
jgi:hypothetical protein